MGAAGKPAETKASEVKQLSAKDLESLPLLSSGKGPVPQIGDSHVQILMLDFWASWCEPCKDSLPDYVALEKKHASRGLRLMTINVDEDKADAEKFLKDLKLEIPARWDEKRVLTKKLALQGVPVLYLLDQNGKILETIVGATRKTKRELPRRIEEAFLQVKSKPDK